MQQKEYSVQEERKDVGLALAESLKDLVQRVPFEKITIKQITDGAGVIRVTFYNHFQDKYDLLGFIVRREILEPVGILLGNSMYKEALTLIFSNLKKDRAFYERAVRIEGQNSFEEITEEDVKKALRRCSLLEDGSLTVEDFVETLPGSSTKLTWTMVTPAIVSQSDNNSLLLTRQGKSVTLSVEGLSELTWDIGPATPPHDFENPNQDYTVIHFNTQLPASAAVSFKVTLSECQ